ncbi:MAG: hypothetical protein C0424_11805 [Sphingobacteriaceae bacterium]|nr:hypothetical protein [Sphingobacteriaceae bacterium]
MQNMPVLVYVERVTPRLKYTVDLVFRYLLGWNYQLTNEAAAVHASEGPILVYSADPLAFEMGLRIKAVDLLFEKGLKEQRLAPAYLEKLPVLFRTHQRYDLPFDPFAAIFYLIARYEEYLPHRADAHQRFQPESSVLHEYGWLQQPLVDHYALLLAVHLRRRWPQLPMPQRQYRFVPTIDVDQLYAFKGKGLLRSMYGLGQSLRHRQWEVWNQHWRVLRKQEADPFDTYAYLRDLHKKAGGEPVYFFLVGDYGGFDNAHSPFTDVFRELVKSTADHFKVGLHPSYRSNHQPSLIDRERKLLEEILHRPVTYSRQHFLKVTLPGTYHQLIKRDFEADFSMAYASQPGFRSGTASVHPFYDLDSESPTSLLVYPTCVMDTTLQQYLQLTPEQAIENIKRLITEVKSVEGTFVSLWHNSSLGENGPWKGWRRVYEALLAEAHPHG